MAEDLYSLRNFGIIAHIDAGKTTTTERVLYYTGKTYKMGEVHEGESQMDWMDQEKERGITITSAATTCSWRPTYDTNKIYRFNIIDTPGHVDFTVEVERSLRVLDGGVVVFDGSQGVEPQSETVWHQADKYEVPRLAFINKMDKTGGDFFMSVKSIHERLNKDAIPIQLPIGFENSFSGLIDLLEQKAYGFTGDKGETMVEIPMPEDMKKQAAEYRHDLIEKIVETDNSLTEKYLDGQKITLEEYKKALRTACIQFKLIPVLCGSSLKNIGVQKMLDAVCDYLPSPLELPAIKGINPKNGETVERHASDDEPFSALVFKIATDPFVGKLAFFRIYSGKLAAGSYVLNSTTDNRERVGRVLRMHANNREEMKELPAGDIGALVGLKNTVTGHTLCDEDNPIILEAIEFPEPVISIAIEPKTKADQEKMGVALNKLSEEDPTFIVSSNVETGQTIISGMGELHLEVLVERMRREFKVEANVGKPQVAYRETITKQVEAEEKYVKQTGGRGQYGHVLLRVFPNEKGKGFEFIDSVVGGRIPREFIPAVRKGIEEALLRGIIAGYPVVDIKAELYDGSYHDVDSSELAFKVAGSICFQKATKQASPILLEPIMNVEVITPESYMGDVMGNLNSKRGQINEMGDRGVVKFVKAKVPLAEMFGYATDLRSMTQGRASYSMEPSHYEKVPENITEKIRTEKGLTKEK